MAWMITARDSADGVRLRQDRVLMDAHWAYEQSIKDKILCAGSLRTDDGKTPIGSLLVLDVSTREEAMVLYEADPATRAGLRQDVNVVRWNKAIFAYEVCD
ncbi:YciI family protein [Aestuariivirga litoralis]|uniref:YciI family protein n=1 Tax=Aestuariivirga litoralis TaxID=2650924 RepID=UPI0018C5D7AC|nr:YciI family protein [Aestuariivirga litoralis]MBG1233557.1 YciI family protein [Aestuariivirga litoralis]